MSGHGSASVHFHNQSFRIRNINGGTGTIEGGTLAELSILKKRNQGDGKKIFQTAQQVRLVILAKRSYAMKRIG